MTRRTNARIAGFTFLFYIAVGLPAMLLFTRATGGHGVAAKLASVAQHAMDMRATILLSLLCGFSALVLAVTLYAITRDEDRDLAMLVAVCRVAEGVVGAAGLQGTLGLLWLATATGADAPAAGHALAAFLLAGNGSDTVSAAFFAAGSTVFSYLLLRGRIVPAGLAWVGLVASVLVLVGAPLQLAGFLRGPATSIMWLPMFAFEVPLGFWLIVKGAAVPARAQEHARAPG
jgi:hypothetical protein